ncbi:MAG: hypothetical protein KAS23_15835, partial [Anaerohalosphaera sp.]|nr:hypothetical protein [Anaerohalosphaera sp.]
SSRAQRSYHLRSFFMYYTADLVLYERSMRLVNLIDNNDNATKFLDSPDPQGTYGKDTFSNYREHFQGIDDVTRITAGKAWMFSANKTYNAKELLEGLGCEYLWHKTEDELSLIEAVSTLEMASMSANNAASILKNAIDKIWFPAQKGVAQWMGNTRIRRVGQYLIAKDQREEMDKHLQPGDILIARKNWYLSNVGLPGFWPHAILYIGDSEKFETYFDTPEVCRYLTELTGETIKLGQYLAAKYPAKYKRYTAGDGEPYRVIEGISHGVVLNTFKLAFGDYMAALRPRLDKKAKAQAIIEAFGHLDKPYDYDFDFATDDALVCTELVWRSYRPAQNKKGIDFDLVEIGGRKTMPANQIALLFANEVTKDTRQLDFVYFLDASEEDQKAFPADQNAFIKSSQRQKWSFSQD